MGIAFDIEKLLKPYNIGGTEISPVKRTLGTISSKLLISHRFPIDIIGIAIYKVFYEMAFNGLVFEGDGSYGSEGAELFSCIRAQCIDLAERQSTDAVVNAIARLAACVNEGCPRRTQKFKTNTRSERVKIFLLKPRGPWRI